MKVYLCPFLEKYSMFLVSKMWFVSWMAEILFDTFSLMNWTWNLWLNFVLSITLLYRHILVTCSYLNNPAKHKPWSHYQSLICIYMLIWCSWIPDSVGSTSNMQSLLEKPGVVPIYNASWPIPSKWCTKGLTVGGKLVFSPTKRKGAIVSSVKTSEVTESSNNGEVILWPKWCRVCVSVPLIFCFL